MNTQKHISSKHPLGREVPLVIPNMGRRELYCLFAELGFNVGAEIGVFMGRNAHVLLETIPNLRLHLVEPYANHPNNEIVYSAQDFSKAKRMTRKRLKNRNVEFLEMFSEEAIKHVPDESLDFVYIDAGHEYDFVMMDMIIWSRKVKKGGIVSGHDYFYKNDKKGIRPYVTAAVNDYARIHGINPWYITDRNKKDKGYGDGYPSWFWVKF
jgi:predicted O-methyltransferase YrrM